MSKRVGQQFGDYRLLRLLGEGGSAEVYFGEHVNLGLQAAVKILHSRQERPLFLHEAQTVTKLTHPSIIRILDSGIRGGVPYLVMTYAPGGTLRQRHPRGSVLPLSQVVTYVQQVAKALDYAHEQGLIHCDVKPENMLLGHNGEILLSDFGIALTSSARAETVGGSIAYMAPEQLLGNVHSASDQYALGIVVYEWLTGDRPFRGTISEICLQHLDTPPASLRSRNPALPAEIDSVVLKALAKEPEQRFPTVQDFADALKACISSNHTLMPGEEVRQEDIVTLSVSWEGSPIGEDETTSPRERFRDIFLAGSPSASEGEKAEEITSPASSAALAPSSSAQAYAALLSEEVAPPAPVEEAAEITEDEIANAPTIGGSAPPMLLEASLNRPAEQQDQLSVPWYLEALPTPQIPPSSASPAQHAQRGQSNVHLAPQKGSILNTVAKRVVAVVVALLLLVLVGGGILYALPRPGESVSPVATGTNIPQQKEWVRSYTIMAVTGTPDASQRQVQARHLSVTIQVGSITAKASGTKSNPARSATGMLLISNYSALPVRLPAGFVISNQGSPAITVVLDRAVVVPPSNILLRSPGTAAVPAHVVPVGAIGNIAAGSFRFNGPPSPIPPGHVWSIANPSPFAGGTNAGKYTYVQKSDIDKAASTLIKNKTPNASQILQEQLKPGEQLAGAGLCKPQTTANPRAGERATSVTVKVSFTCTGDAYDRSAAVSLATNLLKSEMQSANYTLKGTPQISITRITVDAQRNISLLVQAKGVGEVR